MIFQLVALAFVIVATYYVFKTARDNGRSGAGWAVLAAAVGLGVQWFLPIILAIILAVVYVATGTRPDELAQTLETPATVISFACLILSVVGLLLILKLVSRVPDEPEALAVPPPPTFESNNLQ